MTNSKKGINKLIVVFIALIALMGYMFEWKIGSVLNNDRTAYDVIELSALVCRDIDNGKERGSFYISGISNDELSDINSYVSSIYGSVDKYTILTSSKGGRRVRFYYKISDNYYVLRKYLYDEPIPAERIKANMLYDKVCEVIKDLGVDQKSDYDKELAVHDYIVKNCEYGYDPLCEDDSYSAYGALVNNMAVCNGYAEAFSLILSCMGVENCIITGSGGGELHAWNQVKLDGYWYHVDATWDDPVPDRGNYSGHMFFNVSDEIMRETHEWKDGAYNSCDVMDYNYYVYNDLVCDYRIFQNIVINEARRNITGTIEVLAEDYDEKLYDMQFLGTIAGVNGYAIEVSDFGKYKMITLYLNKFN